MDGHDLTYDHLLALVLVTHRGLTYREVAERMERAPGDVLRLLGDALHGLGEVLGPPAISPRAARPAPG